MGLVKTKLILYGIHLSEQLVSHITKRYNVEDFFLHKLNMLCKPATVFIDQRSKLLHELKRRPKVYEANEQLCTQTLGKIV